MENSVTKFSMKRNNIVGIDNEPDEYHDLMDIVIVRRGGNPESDSIFDYIDAVYSNDIKRVEKYTDNVSQEVSRVWMKKL